MDQLLRQILDEIRGAWRFRWQAMALAWVIAVVGAAVVLALPDKYEATAQVYVDTTDPLTEGRRDANTDLQLKVAYVRRLLLSRPNLERVARDTDLDLRAPTPEAFEVLVTKLQSQISVRAESETGRRGGGRFESNLYTIAYQDESRSAAERVVQTLLNTFQEQSLEGDLREDRQALTFLDSQVELYRKRLEDAEARVAEFKSRNSDVLGGSGFFSNLNSLQEQLRQTRSNLKIALDKRATLAAQVGAAGSSSGDEGGSTSLAALESQVLQAQQNLDQLRLRYTDQHPSVISAEETLAALEARLEKKKQELGPLLSSGVGGAVIENVRIALSQADVEVAELRSRERDLSARIEELQAKVNVAPQLEAELAGLVRDHSVLRSQYENLLTRREDLRLEIERKTQGKQLEFRIIEPPLAPQAPVAPDRLRLLALVLAAALGAGAGLTFLMHQLKPVYLSADSVYNELQVPVLGTVSMAWTARANRSRRSAELGFVGALLLLVAVFGVVFFKLPELSSLAQRLVS